MPELSEFVEFVIAKSGIRKPSLVEKDILIHRVLREIVLSDLVDIFIVKPPAEFYRFIERIVEVLREIGESVLRK